MIRVSVTLLVVLSLMSIAPGCGGGSDDGTTSVDVGYAYGMDVGDVGDNLAFARLQEERGIEVTTRDMGGGSGAVAGLTRGDIQLGQLTYLQLLDAIAAGAPIKAVLGQNMTPEFVLAGGEGIESVEDLKGKTVAVSSPDSSGFLMLRLALARAGLSLDDVEVVYMDESTTRAPALAAGRLDAAALDYADVAVLDAREPGRFNVVARASDLFPKVPSTLWAVDTEWAKEHGELLEETLQGLLDGYESMYDGASRDRWIAEARKLFLKGEDAEVAAGLHDFYRKVAIWPQRSTLTTKERHDKAVEALVASKQVEQGASYEDAWLTDYWPED